MSRRTMPILLIALLATAVTPGGARADDSWIELAHWQTTDPQTSGLQLVAAEPASTVSGHSLFAEALGDRAEWDEPEGLAASLFDLPTVQQAAFGEPYVANRFQGRPTGWQFLPQGHLYQSYLAGEKESRMAAQILYDSRRGWAMDAALGGRWGIVRDGTYGADDPQGFQLDMEGAALARVDFENRQDLEAADFRAGLVGTWRDGPWRWKTGYYHLSSHAGDEYMIRVPTFQRINYVRDAVLIGGMYDVTTDLQAYGEIAVALNRGGGAEPLELQFGLQYSPVSARGLEGAPFAAINGHLRQEFDFGGSVNAMAGWQWRGGHGDHLFRVGVQHYNGASMQWEFFDRYESMTGFGIWFDY